MRLFRLGIRKPNFVVNYRCVVKLNLLLSSDYLANFIDTIKFIVFCLKNDDAIWFNGG
jgi:hypothetical protein